MKNVFTEEMKNKVLDLIAEDCYLPEDYNYNLIINTENDEPTITLVIRYDSRVFVINQYCDNEQTISTFLANGDNMICATIPWKVMEVSNSIRHMNGCGKFGFAWDYINE